MPAPVIGGIILAAGSVGSAAIQAHQAGKARDAEVEANKRALGVAQQQYQNAQQLYQPYISGQATAGLNAPVTGGGGYVPGRGLIAAPQARPAMGAGMPAGASATGMGGNMVLMQAPTGETQHVPPSDVQKYIARGAKVIG